MEGHTDRQTAKNARAEEVDGSRLSPREVTMLDHLQTHTHCCLYFLRQTQKALSFSSQQPCSTSLCQSCKHTHILTHTYKDSQPYHSFASLHVCLASTQHTRTHTHDSVHEIMITQEYSCSQWILLRRTHTIFYRLHYLVHDWSSFTLLQKTHHCHRHN